MADSAQRAAQWRARCEAQLAERLAAADRTPRRLHDAMRYSALAEGKRMRPLLVYASGHALGVDAKRLDPVACAVECIHAYSLIHDDLPAMDDDDLRRGSPTCHRAFDEATAILAGDALQALAFELLARDEWLRSRPAVAVSLIEGLARACGSAGMAGGQMIDLDAVGASLDASSLEQMHEMKTGALIRYSVTAPALLVDANRETLDALSVYGHAVGLAFQIHDDILDVVGDPHRTGKAAQADAAHDKPNYPSTLGLDASRARAAALHREALDALDAIDGDTTPLAWLANYVVERDH